MSDQEQPYNMSIALTDPSGKLVGDVLVKFYKGDGYVDLLSAFADLAAQLVQDVWGPEITEPIEHNAQVTCNPHKFSEVQPND